MHQQVAVVPPQVVEDHRDGSDFWIQPQLEVTGIVGCPSEFPCYVAVVTHRVTLESFVTDVAIGRRFVCQPILSSHSHGLWVDQLTLDFGLFMLESSQ